MNISRRVSLIGVCAALMLASLSCRNGSDAATSAKDKDLKSDSYLVFFAGWRFPADGIVLAKNKSGASGDTYFSLASPESEPSILETAKVDLKIDNGFSGRELSAHSGKRKVSTSFKEDNFGRLQNAEAILTETAAPPTAVKLAEGKEANWSICGWSADDKSVVFSRNGKVFFVDAATKEKTDVESKSIFFASQIVMDDDRNGFYIAGKNSSGGYDLDYFDFSTKKETNILSLEKPAVGKMTNFHGDLSPDKKTLAVFESVHDAENRTHFDAANSLRFYDFQTGELIKQYDLPAGEMRLNDEVYFSGQVWRGDNREIAFNVTLPAERKVFSSIDIQSGKTTEWFSSGK